MPQWEGDKQERWNLAAGRAGVAGRGSFLQHDARIRPLNVHHQGPRLRHRDSLEIHLPGVV